MSAPPIRLAPLSYTTIRLCEEIDEVRYFPQVQHIGTGFMDGKLWLLVGDAYTNIPVYAEGNARQRDADYLREQLLLHEAWHVLLGHDRRQQDRTNPQWNLACDAVIHQRAKIDLAALERVTRGAPVTFATLDLPPCPPERAYDFLMERTQDERRRLHDVAVANSTGTPETDTHAVGAGGCGRLAEHEVVTLLGGDTNETGARGRTGARRATVVEQLLNGAAQDARAADDRDATLDSDPARMDSVPVDAGTGASPGRDNGQPHRPMPAWVGDLLAQLSSARRGRTERVRTYRREHRGAQPLLPGRGRGQCLDVVIFVDASDSIDRTAMRQMQSALRDSAFADADTYVFDTDIHGPFRAADTVSVQQAVDQCGGGTLINAAWEAVAERVDHNATCVWLTDAASADGLPPDTGKEVWVHFGGPAGNGQPDVIDREELNRRLWLQQDPDAGA